jgi:ATP-dependent Zn protease
MVATLGMGEGLSYLDAVTPKARSRLVKLNADVAERVERILGAQMKRCRNIVRQHRQAIETVEFISFVASFS